MSIETDSIAKGIQTLTFSEASIGDNNLVAAVAGQRVLILGLYLSANGGLNTASLQDTGGAVNRSPVWDLAAEEEVQMQIAPPGRFWEVTADGTGLDLNLSAATAVSGVLVYQQF